MKKLLMVLGALVVSFAMQAQSNLTFVNGTLTEIMEKAKKEKKSILVEVTNPGMIKEDMIASLDKEVFSDAVVKKTLSDNFICFKANMGDEAVRNEVTPFMSGSMYPCYLLLHSNGDKLGTANHYGALKDKNAFVETLKKAVAKADIKRNSSRKINFLEMSLEDAKKLAKKENKLIFIDAMFEGCHWCTEMEKDTYTLDEVADFYNKNFICLKIDFLKEKEVAKVYKATGFPSYFYVTGDGKQLLLESGYTPSGDKFIGYGKTAMNKMNPDKPKSVPMVGF